MSLLPILFFAGVLLLFVVSALVLSQTALKSPFRDNTTENVVLACRIFGLVQGTIAGYFVSTLGQYSQFSGAVPAVIGLGLVCGVVVGEAVRWGSRTNLGEAVIETRSLKSYLPAKLKNVELLNTAVFVFLLIYWWVAADADGRSISRTLGNYSGSASPFPGWYYQLPAIVVLLILSALAIAGMKVSVDRPRNGTSDAAIADDDAARRLSVRAILLSWVASLSLTGAGLAFYSSTALQGLSVNLESSKLLPMFFLAMALFFLLQGVICIVMIGQNGGKAQAK